MIIISMNVIVLITGKNDWSFHIDTSEKPPARGVNTPFKIKAPSPPDWPLLNVQRSNERWLFGESCRHSG